MKNKIKTVINIIGVIIPLFVIFLFGFWLNERPGHADEVTGAQYYADSFSIQSAESFAENVKVYLTKDKKMARPAEAKCPIAQSLPDRVTRGVLSGVFGSEYKNLKIKGSVAYKGAIYQDRVGLGYRIDLNVEVFANFPIDKFSPSASLKEWVSAAKNDHYFLTSTNVNGTISDNSNLDLLCSFNVNSNLN